MVAMFEMEFMPAATVVAAAYDALGSSLRSFRKPLEKAVREVAIPSIQENFDSGGRPPWAPNAASTVAQKGHGNVLINSGTLEGAATQLNLWSYTREEAWVSNLPERAWYGIVHQKGGYAGRAGVLPARPFLMLQDEDVEKIEDIFVEWVGERLGVEGWTV